MSYVNVYRDLAAEIDATTTALRQPSPRHATEADLAEKRAKAYGYLEARGIARYRTNCRHRYTPHDSEFLFDSRVEVTVCRHHHPHPTVHIATRG